MEDIYPQGPSSVPRHFARPSGRYRRQAWLAMTGLAIFVMAYGALAGWFVWMGYGAFAAAVAGSSSFIGFIAGAGAWFLAAFMLKSLFFIRRGAGTNGIEIGRAGQPKLFTFLDRLADEAGAPRPHRVYVSSQVNAAVFYDLSVLNLLWPSRKNLIIGLGLVNVLSLSEFKAVCAHEFGHFAQRSMAVGRWVYTAQQIAGHIVATRGALDKFLDGLSRFDLRIAWIGFVLRAIVWAIRALIDSLFRVVLMAQRALSREMEMQADLVSVSLTGSDALIDALHKMPAADDAWDRTIQFINGELAAGRITRDAFAIQTRTLALVGGMLGIPDYGQVPPRPHGSKEYRLFKPELAQPPRMWATHPLSHEREENAKRVYLQVPIDARAAWALFDQAPALREQVTAHLIGKRDGAEPADMVESIQRLESHFSRVYNDRGYRGLYLNRSPVLGVARAEDLAAPTANVTADDLERLYPESLTAELEQLRELEKEHALLVAVRDGVYVAQGGVVHYRGRSLSRTQLPAAISEVERDLARVRESLAAQDKRCRSMHQGAAAELNPAWQVHLQGLAALLHYADHALANLRDAEVALSQVVAIATATARASKSDVTEVMKAADHLHEAMLSIYRQARKVDPRTQIMLRMGQSSWSDMLGDFALDEISRKQINPWLKAAGSWVNHFVQSLMALRNATLEQLLESEAAVATQLRDGGTVEPAPPAPGVPREYAVVTPASSRVRKPTLGWWKRFQSGQGVLPAMARLAVACAIVGAVVGAGWSIASQTIEIHNGLDRPVRVVIDGQSTTLAAFASDSMHVAPGDEHAVSSSDLEGHQIESFQARSSSYSHAVYNVDGASALVQWTATYGPAQGAATHAALGNPRWLSTTADDLFTDPPHSVQTQYGEGATRTVLSAAGDARPDSQLQMLRSDAERAALIAIHSRWDAPHSAYLLDWLQLERSEPDNLAVLAARLARDPADVAALRARQDAAGARHPAICAEDRARAASQSGQADLAYVAARCIDDEQQRNAAFAAGRRRWPDNAWFAYADAYTAAGQAHWSDALAGMTLAIHAEPLLRVAGVMEIARMRRMLARNPEIDLSDLFGDSAQLEMMGALEHQQRAEGVMGAYVALAHGDLDRAVQMAIRAPDETFILRQAAASDGASAELIQRALALPEDQGIGGSSIWPAIALNMREHGRSDKFATTLANGRTSPEASHGVDQMLAFLQLAQEGHLVQAEARLDGVAPYTRGEAYAAGVVLLGPKAPKAWRIAARCLLFAAERPYLG